MGLIKHGILGGFRKKTGTVIGAYWRSLDVIRALPRSSGKAPSQAQKEQQLKFALITAFLNKASGLIDQGFKSAGPATPMNKAFAYHIKEAITGTYPDFVLNMEKFVYSIGSLELPDTATAEATGSGMIRFVWDRTTDEDKLINPADTVTVVAYNADKQRFVKQVAATTRGVGQFELQLPAVFADDVVQLYISFSSELKNQNSNSMYLGTATVQG